MGVAVEIQVCRRQGILEFRVARPLNGIAPGRRFVQPDQRRRVHLGLRAVRGQVTDLSRLRGAVLDNGPGTGKGEGQAGEGERNGAVHGSQFANV